MKWTGSSRRSRSNTGQMVSSWKRSVLAGLSSASGRRRPRDRVGVDLHGDVHGRGSWLRGRSLIAVDLAVNAAIPNAAHPRESGDPVVPSLALFR